MIYLESSVRSNLAKEYLNGSTNRQPILKETACLPEYLVEGIESGGSSVLFVNSWMFCTIQQLFENISERKREQSN